MWLQRKEEQLVHNSSEMKTFSLRFRCFLFISIIKLTVLHHIIMMKHLSIPSQIILDDDRIRSSGVTGL